MNIVGTPRSAGTCWPKIKHIYLLILCISLGLNDASGTVLDAANLDPQQDYGDLRLTREYDLRQGALRGFIVQPSRHYQMQQVEIFLGIPYAAPPIGKLRFMPPGSALPWPNVKLATNFAPVCLQRFPDVKKADPPAPGRLNYLKKMYQYLRNQSEDCLYLNIYVPYRESRSKKFPVLIFIHGDSFEWGSGNSYDARVLSSYGNIVVITLNYRLGIFGFLKPSVSEGVYGNNGLLDLLAALQWVKENIEDLNGDPNSVTLMGHSVGAACVHYLMMSPISSGLFHRAILMSGSALSDWALTHTPLQYTLQVAQSLGCNLTYMHIMDCLQNKPQEKLNNVQILSRKFETPLGPIVAGSFIPFEPERSIELNSNILSKFNVLAGVTESESYHEFNVIMLAHGMLETERATIMKEFAEVVYGTASKKAADQIIAKYAPESQLDPHRWTVEKNRDVVLDVLSDARTTAPLVKMIKKQSKLNKHTYFYVFGHNSEATPFAALKKSVNGQELPYVLGVPLGETNSHFHKEFSKQEKLLSEVIMRLWTNFVKSGHPNSQRQEQYLTLRPEDWVQYDIDWPEYNTNHQSFLRLGIPPFVGSYFRQNLTNFWNDVLLDKLKSLSVSFDTTYFPSSTQSPNELQPVNAKHLQKSQTGTKSAVSFENELQGPDFIQYGKPKSHPPLQKPKSDNIYREIISIKTPPIYKSHPELKENNLKTEKPVQQLYNKEQNETLESSQSVYNLIVVAGCIFVVIKLSIFSAIFIKKRKLSLREQRLKQNNEDFNIDQITPEENKCPRSKINNLFFSDKLMKLFKTRSFKNTNDEKPCNSPVSDDSGGFGRRQRFKLRRHLSSSTIDTQTKVREWMSKDVFTRFSPYTCRKKLTEVQPKPHVKLTKSEEIISSTAPKKTESVNFQSLHVKKTTSEKSTSTQNSTFSIKSKDISVSTDQNEICKLRDAQKNEKATQSVDCTDSRFEYFPDVLKETKNTSSVFINISNTALPCADNIEMNKSTIINHKHSVSDPVREIDYEEITLESGIHVLPVEYKNVTSLDDNVTKTPLTPEQSLLSIQRRRYPKVLPDYPKLRDKEKRYSLQPLSADLCNDYQLTNIHTEKNPPHPPPRTTSTLDRHFRNQSKVQSQKKENTVSCVPKNLDEIENLLYSEVKRKPRVIIAAGSEKNEDTKFFIMTSVIETPKQDLENGIRVKLRDSFHSSDDPLIKSLLSDTESQSENDQDDIENDLINKIVGFDFNERYNFDSKGPEIVDNNQHDVIKINTFSPLSKSYEGVYFDKCVDAETEKTAQIKQKISLSKLHDRSNSIEEPPKRIYKAKDLKKPGLLPRPKLFKKTASKKIGVTAVTALNKSLKSKNVEDTSVSDICGSDSSIDTGSSAETVKEAKNKDSND